MKCLLPLFLLALSLCAQQTPKAESLLQSGIKKETVDGNLPAAIEDYKKAVTAAKSDRAVAARALYQLAQCYRKQGDAQAKSTLERLVREFGDQPYATQARAQLAALATPSAAGGMRLQKLLDEKKQACSSVSFDGKLLGCAVNWIDEAAVYEIETGRLRVLTALRKETPANRYINTFAISPDGRTMALHIYRAGGVFSEIALVPTDGTGTLKTVYKHPKDGWLDVVTWTPDSKEVLFSPNGDRGNRVAPLLALHISTGATRQLREIRSGSLQWVHTTFSPDGKWLAINVRNPEPGSYNVEIWNAAGEFVSQVTTAKESGNVAGWSPDGKFLVLGSAQPGPSGLLKYPVSEGKVTGSPQTIRASIEGFTRPKGIDSKGTLYFTGGRIESRLFSAVFDPAARSLSAAAPLHSESESRQQGFGTWSPDGKRFAAWTFAGMNMQVVARPQLTVRNLPSGPETISVPETPFQATHVPAWDPEGKHLFMLAEAAGGSVRIVRFDPASGKVTPASIPVPMPNIGFAPDWSKDGRFLYLRKEDRNLYRIDAQSGEEKIIYTHPADESGLRNMAISPDGACLAYFGATRIMKSGGEWTGTSHWWIHVLDLATGVVKNIETPHGFAWGASVLAWSPDGRTLVYVAGGGSNSGEQSSIWTVPSDGSAAPKALTSPLGGRAMHLAFSPDGRTLSYTLATMHEDVWMMSNFLGEAK